MNKKLVKVLALALAIPLVFGGFAGCASKNKKSALEVRIVVENADADTYRVWFDEFEKLHKDKGYSVRMIPVGGGQIIGKQDNMNASGSPADVIIGGDVHLKTQQKYLEPLDAFLARDSAEVAPDDFLPELMTLLKADGNTFYLPEFFTTSLLYYNKGLFDEHNADPKNKDAQVSYPSAEWTYDDFLSNAKKLTKKSGNDYLQWGCYSTIGWYGEWLIHIQQSGGTLMNDQGYFTLDTPEAKEGFTRYLDKMRGANKVSFTKGELDLGGFAGKKTAMIYGGHTREWISYRKLSDLNWDVELLPSVDGNRDGELAINGLGIHKDSNAKEAAWSLIKFLTRKKTGAELVSHPYTPCRTSEKDELLAMDAKDVKAPKNMSAVFESLKYNKTMPQWKYLDYVITQIVERELTKAIDGTATAEAALAAATKNANNYIRSNYK